MEYTEYMEYMSYMDSTEYTGKKRKIKKYQAYINAMIEYAQGLNYGFFITVNSNVSSFDRKIRWSDYETMEKTFDAICRGLNIYCYGQKIVDTVDRARNVSLGAAEIGKETGRLHMHMVMLNREPTNRPFSDVQDRFKMVCGFSPLAESADATQIQLLIPRKKCKLLKYIYKSCDFKSKNPMHYMI